MTDTFRKEYRPLSEMQKTRIACIKEKADHLLNELNDLDNIFEFDQRMSELAKIKLEECVMWAVKSIT